MPEVDPNSNLFKALRLLYSTATPVMAANPRPFGEQVGAQGVMAADLLRSVLAQQFQPGPPPEPLTGPVTPQVNPPTDTRSKVLDFLGNMVLDYGQAPIDAQANRTNPFGGETPSTVPTSERLRRRKAVLEYLNQEANFQNP